MQKRRTVRYVQRSSITRGCCFVFTRFVWDVLNSTVRTDKLPGDDVTCPVCRTATEIPKDGLTALTVRMHGKEYVSFTTCEACSSCDRGVSATVYCVDCSQNLCERCSIPHKRMKGGSHDVKALEALSPGYHGARRYCGEHQERIRMYCFDCRANVCSTCCFEAHKRHSFERID